jgi:hypothetical protein
MEEQSIESHGDEMPQKRKRRKLIVDEADEIVCSAEEIAANNALADKIEKRYNEKKRERIASRRSFILKSILKCSIIIVLLLGAIIGFKYWYYMFLRWFVCIVSGYLCSVYDSEKKFRSQMLFLAIFILFNPLIKFWASKNVWIIIDFITIALMILSIYIEFKNYNKKKLMGR